MEEQEVTLIKIMNIKVILNFFINTLEFKSLNTVCAT